MRRSAAIECHFLRGWRGRGDDCLGATLAADGSLLAARGTAVVLIRTRKMLRQNQKKLRTSCPACCCSRGRPDQRFACGRVFVTLGRLSRRPSMAQRGGLRNHNIVPAVRSRLIRASINARRYLINSLFDWPYLAGTLINFIETHISR